MEKNKLREIQKELIICEKPSSYLEEIKDSLRNTPLDALLILQNTEQNLKYHPEGNVWNHVMQVIDTAAKVKEFANDKESLMMGALLHDVGKGPTTKKNKQGRWISYNHDVEGVKLAEKILDYYNYENDEKSKILNLIKYHMHHLYIIQDLPFAKTKEMIKDVDLNDMILLFISDRLGRGQLEDNKKSKRNRRYKKSYINFRRKLQFGFKKYKGKSEKNRKNYIKFKLHIFTYEYTRNYYHIIKI